jgi:DNA helicase-2/ATP-dependent DNA helicase PcrA
MELRQSGELPSVSSINMYFADILGRKNLKKSEHKRLENRGREALERFIKEKGKVFEAKDLAERGFNNDGVVVGEARLSGKIDILHFKNASKAEVIDFKTGRPAADWRGKDDFEAIKIHKYRQQLLFYKLLVENSASYQGKLAVDKGRIEFIEADANGKLLAPLELDYSPDELTAFAGLINAVWRRIMNLDFPDVSKYPATISGVREFEKFLLEEPSAKS